MLSRLSSQALFFVVVSAGIIFSGLSHSVSADEKVVTQWRFDREGDFRGWQPAGNIKDVSVSGGALRGAATDRDPIISGPLFEIVATPTQHIEIKMKCDEVSSSELFWTNSTAGKYGGFSQERCNNLQVRGDGRFHVYRIDPFWHAAGKIVRLRFDPPNKGRFAVEWIRIVETGDGPVSNEKAWKFDKQTDGWRLRPGGGSATIQDGGLLVLPQQEKTVNNTDGSESENELTLISPRLSLRAEENPFVCVRMAVKTGRDSVAAGTDLAGRIRCVSKSRLGFSETTFPLRADGETHTYNINMKSLDKWHNEIIMIALQLPRAVSSEFRIESIEVGPRPGGPADLVVDYFGPTDGVNRAGRSAEVNCAVSNLGGQTAENVTLTLAVPPGVKIIGPATQNIRRISHYVAKQAAWSIEAQRPGTVEVSLKIEVSGAESANTGFATAKTAINFSAAPQVAKADYVPEPRPVKSKYDVGVFYFPGWHSMDRWRPILDYPMRKPVLGWYDEANPECVDWQIKWAVEHGVKFFMVDWYWDRGRRHLEHWLHDGFMKARHRRYLKWAVMWANHNQPGSHSKEDWRKVTQYWIDNYFGTEEYYKIDGRPAVFLWAPDNIRNDVGGSDRAAELYAMSQEMAKAAGHKGIYFVAMHSHNSPGQCRQLEAEGFEGTTEYHGFQLAQQEARSQRFPFADVVRTSPRVWQQEEERSGKLTYMPIVDSGWASQPWHHNQALVIHDRTPELFGQLCREARAFADVTGNKIIAVGPWNEWGEGSYIEPYAQYGFGDLDRMRDAFCEPGDYPPNLDSVGCGPGPVRSAIGLAA